MRLCFCGGGKPANCDDIEKVMEGAESLQGQITELIFGNVL